MRKHEHGPEPYEIFTPKRAALAMGVITLIAITGNLLMPRTMETNERAYEYPLHTDIPATVFWVGEDADSSNGYIHNRSSAWTQDWVAAFGGTDDPNCRRENHGPCGLTPNENWFYVALPFGDRTEEGMKSAKELAAIPWYNGIVDQNESLLKNQWVEIRIGDKRSYAQLEDVGPFNEDDADYVFDGERPEYAEAGIDLSPAVADHLGIDGRGVVDWRFVSEQNVPDGPWREVITRSKPD